MLAKKEAVMPFKPDSRLYRSFTASNFKPVERELPDLDDEEHEYEPTSGEGILLRLGCRV